MNSSDGSLEDGPSIVTKAFLGISLGSSFGSTFESVLVVSVSLVSRDCKDRSKRSISRGLFRTL